MTDIYTKTPINKLAAIVTGQKGVSVGITEEQRRDSLVAKWKSITNQIMDLPKNDPQRKRLGKQQHEISLKINAIRAKMKGDKSLQHYIITIIRERMTKSQWNDLMEEAIKRKKVRGIE